MQKPVRIGILRETKNPPDRRVALTPPQIIKFQEQNPDVEFIIQPSDLRCYSDEEYEYLKIPLREDLGECDILMGIKEIMPFVGKLDPFSAAILKKVNPRKPNK